MSKTITIDPITRIEGHLAFRVNIAAQRVQEAFCAGEMFRGFEVILKGRHPFDAQQITQRICGICPISHGIASILAQEQAYQLLPPRNGLLVRNLIQAGNTIMSHIMHFYHLCALDFLDIMAITSYAGHDVQLQQLKDWVQTQLRSNLVYPAAPFLPRYDGTYAENSELNVMGLKHYLEALTIRAVCHKMIALFCGKVPHAPALVPGGVTEHVTVENIAAYASMLREVQTFITTAYLPDVLAIAEAFPEYWERGQGYRNFLTYGAFPETSDGARTFAPAGVVYDDALMPFHETAITEDVLYAFFASQSGLPPFTSQSVPNVHKTGAYSWIKAPRYDGNAMEVGPLARLMVAYHQESPAWTGPLKKVLARAGKTCRDLVSVMGRHLVRAIEAHILAEQSTVWLAQLVPGASTCTPVAIPQNARGMGLTEAPRGALGHWLILEKGLIKHYQCVVPTTWNCSPRDDAGQPGVIEQALVGTPVMDAEHPIEVARVVRSFDPCIACAVH